MGQLVSTLGKSLAMKLGISLAGSAEAAPDTTGYVVDDQGNFLVDNSGTQLVIG